MKFKFIPLALVMASFGLWSFLSTQENPLTVYLVGDSTMSEKETKAYPETGWGMPFVHFFDETVKVENHAQNGRSTKTFIEENRWQPVAQKLKPGDYVFIQFGHNDEVPTKKSYTSEKEFRANLNRFISETKAKKAIPVMLTPVARRKFDSLQVNKIVETHAVYSGIVREVAAQNKIALIDLDRKSQQLLQEFGPDKSKLLFMHLAPGEHPNYPKGKVDDTHFNELGARLVAQLILADIKAQKLSLADRIVKR